MPLLETKGAASAQGFGGAGAGSSGPVNYIEDVFSTYLYTGNGSTQTITNGIDLAAKGGLVWFKSRNNSTFANSPNCLTDSVTGFSKYLISEQTQFQQNWGADGPVPKSYGFDLPINGSVPYTNYLTGSTYASWTFRKQPKFFDVVTYTGDGVAGRQISHALGSTPGFLVVKRTNTAGNNWICWHRSISGSYISLNTTVSAVPSQQFVFGNDVTSINPTSTVFTVASDPSVNASGSTYVAYLFAHNAGGFGLTNTDNVISCGSYTTDSSGNATINLGYEPQFLLVKRSDSSSNWILMDVMRGQSQTNSNPLYADLSSAEASYSVGYFPPTATGFKCNAGLGTGVQTHIYIAIRRGPMKVPTSGTSVFMPLTRTGTGASATVSGVGFPPDLVMPIGRSPAGYGDNPIDRLRGNSVFLKTYSTAAEVTDAAALPAWTMDGFTVGASGTTNDSGVTYVYENFRRAPGFFDEVCYTGNGPGTQVINHNLTVVPELVINKVRSTTSGWTVFQGDTTALTGFLRLNETSAAGGDTLNVSSTTITVDSTIGFGMNTSGQTYVTYLFASCPGVSKVGRFTGTGATQVINCGFTGGARFVLIKARSTTGDWYVWDSARGIVAGNDPYLELNTTDAEVTGTDWVDTASTGFELSNAAGNLANSNGVTYIFLAIA